MHLHLYPVKHWKNWNCKARISAHTNPLLADSFALKHRPPHGPPHPYVLESCETIFMEPGTANNTGGNPPSAFASETKHTEGAIYYQHIPRNMRTTWWTWMNSSNRTPTLREKTFHSPTDCSPALSNPDIRALVADIDHHTRLVVNFSTKSVWRINFPPHGFSGSSNHQTSVVDIYLPPDRFGG